MNIEAKVKKALTQSGIHVDGDAPWDIQVKDNRFYKRVLASGTLGLGESYVDGWWESDDIAGTIGRLSRIPSVSSNLETLFFVLQYAFLNIQKRTNTIAKHYNVGNALYESFLDSSMQYSAGCFKSATDTLEVAQIQKMDAIVSALDIQHHDNVLDLGAGWGGFARYASSTYGCSVTGVSIADAQITYAEKRSKGLPVTFVKKDYRHVTGEFDKVVICELLEHVGEKNYSNAMKHVASLVRPGGKAFVQVTTGKNKLSRGFDPWLHKYIFPTGMIPRKERIIDAAHHFFAVTEVTNEYINYEKTLLLWFERFEKSRSIIEKAYGPRFYRMWKYYLLFCAGTFREGINTSTQIVLTKRA